MDTLPARPPGEYIVQDHSLGGTQMLAYYPNGYGASVIQFAHSYGGREGFWELAVLHGDYLWGPKQGARELCYVSPITSDVVGWLTPPEVAELMVRISRLPPKVRCEHSRDWTYYWQPNPYTAPSDWTGDQMKGSRG